MFMRLILLNFYFLYNQDAFELVENALIIIYSNSVAAHQSFSFCSDFNPVANVLKFPLLTFFNAQAEIPAWSHHMNHWCVQAT